jgi:CelD/BcsL family acetyltransferase involved in cellulose biosynthesis
MTEPLPVRDWTTFPSVGTATAPQVGPFPFRSFLEAAWSARADVNTDLVIGADGTGAVAFAVSQDRIEFAGDQNITDYHSPIGPEPVSLIASTLSDVRGKTFRFDSLPAEAVEPMVTALQTLDATFTTAEHEVAAVLALPDSFEQWLMSIGKKERHEVRRKRKRFDTEFGETRIVMGGTDSLEEFCEMHRRSGGDKGSFMTPEMEQFFNNLVTTANAVVHNLSSNGQTLATAFGFETPDGYYFYNSAFEPGAAGASPGVVLFSSMIEAQIERGAKVFDFLKGNERYKLRHGAEARILYAVEGRLP